MVKKKEYEKLPKNESPYKGNNGDFVKFKRIMARLDAKLKKEAETRKVRKNGDK